MTTDTQSSPVLLINQSLDCGEGPVWDVHGQQLFWTDSDGDTIFSWREGAKEHSVLRKGVRAASITLHANGGLMLCGPKGFYHLQENGDVRVVAEMCDGRPIEYVNDIIADPLGRVFGGQEKFHEGEVYDPGFLYRIDLDGCASVVEEGLHISNGMAFSPDLSTFYLIDTIPRKVYAYDYHLGSGSISNRRVLLVFEQDQGLPDGMTVDREGFLWIASWFGNGVLRFDPEGRLERTIPLPAAQTSSLTFGGKELNEIFVTSAATFWISELAPRGHDYDSDRGGGVYHIKQDIVGLPEYQARV